jgi:hypothetical protein
MDEHAAPIVASWKRRLIALADAPAYVFRDTPKSLVDQHYRRLTEFKGYTSKEVDDVESRLEIRFPTIFRAYLLEMARSPGDLFCGSDLARISEFESFAAFATALIGETDAGLSLPSRSVVFLKHQGYTFTYIVAAGGFDSSAFQWSEGEHNPQQIAPSFADLVSAELDLMEETNRQSRAQGGYYLTIHADGSHKAVYPALNGGDRPLTMR